MLNNHFTAKLLKNFSVEEFWQNYGHEFGVQFFWHTLYSPGAATLFDSGIVYNSSKLFTGEKSAIYNVTLRP